MIKVLIVDDEFYSRKGISKVIPWKDFGCEVCGEADNAYDAIDIAISEKPEIIITDINMPEMDGLEMAKNIRAKNPHTKFIVITGYDDFNYARGAIKINALDFLLKPVDIDELKAAIEKCTESIIKDKETSLFAKEKKLIGILRGEEEIEKIKDFFKEEDRVALALINNDDFETDLKSKEESEYIKINSFIDNWISENMRGCYNISQVHIYRTLVMIKDNKEEDFKNLIDAVKKKFNCTITISITEINNINKVRELYKEAKQLLNESFYKGKGIVINEKIDIYKCNYDIKYIEDFAINIIDLILKGESSEARKQCNKLFKYFVNNRVEKGIIVSFIVKTIVNLKNGLKSLDISLEGIGEVDIVSNLSSIYELESNFMEQINMSIDKIREYKGKLEDSSMERAIIYTKNNYNENISLKSVAKEVYLNESYLSRGIKQNLGMGFTEYIRKLRIEKSIELLKKGNSIVSIAKEVGYGDYRQFTLNFKKYTGCTPSNYNIKS